MGNRLKNIFLGFIRRVFDYCYKYYCNHREPVKRALCLLLLLIVLLLLCALLNKCGKEEPAQNSSAEASQITPTPEPTATPEPTPAAQKPDAETLYSGSLVLVNNSVLWSFPEMELVSLSDYPSACYGLSNSSHKLQKNAFTALDSMLTACAAETGNTGLVIISSYRTKEMQQTLWNRSMENNGKEHTENYFATPGGSEHHTGLAVDLGVKTDTGKNKYFEGNLTEPWIYNHMAEYGFILRYREEKKDITGISAESWHLRYVGVPHAALIEQNGFCLEEYLQYLKQYTRDEPLTGLWGGKRYTIWYESAESATLPEDTEYDISGDNMGGCIITAWKTENQD